MGVEINTWPDVLVPREETQTLGHAALRLLAGFGESPVIVDMCCGCGNLALVVASRIPGARVWASDITDAAVAAARHNAACLGLSDRVTVVQGDLFAGLDSAALEGQVDLVMCNPPYISTGRLAADRASLLENEPREAFDGGPYGISIQQRLIREALAFIRPSGWLAFEFGVGQEHQAVALVARTRAYDVEFVADAEGTPRVLLARRKAASHAVGATA